ncbi:hypothetical protein [Modestobacter sp. NPDC049651]|uniref:hypothetical protein n=1 Tax=unclassified Modestobacter TaxID=2643866 RepID=UPI0033D623DF
MGRRRRVLAVGGVLVAAGVAVPAAVAGASPQDGRPGRDGYETTLEFEVRFSPFDYTDLGAPGPSAADTIVFRDTLWQDGRQVGDEVGSCVVVDPTGLSNCTGVVRLDGDDTIAFSLVNAPPPRKTLAVTGGSGRYRAVRGDGVLVERGDEGSTGTLTLRLAVR